MTEPMSTPDSGGLRAAVEALADEMDNPDRHGRTHTWSPSAATAIRAALAAHPEPVPTEEVHLSTDESEPVPTHDSEAGRLRQQRDAMQALAERNAEDAALWRAQFNRQHGASSGLWVNPDGTTQPVISSTLSAGPTFDDLLADPTQQLDEEGVVAASIPTPVSADDATVGERGCRWSDARGRWEWEIRPGVSKEACGHLAHTRGGDLYMPDERPVVVTSATPPATPPADDANRAPVSGGLGEAEWDHVSLVAHGVSGVHSSANLKRAVDRILAARDAAWVERLAAVEGERDDLMRASFDAYVKTGADTDGDEKWHCTPEWAGKALVHAAETLHKDYDDALDEITAAEAERDTARRETGEAGAKAVRDAADEVHRESRWSLEQAMQGKPQDAVDRLLVLERVLRARADALTSDDGSGA